MNSTGTYDLSRDPRLNKRIPTPSSTTQLQPNNPPVVNGHAALSGDQFLQSISTLIRTAVETSVIQAENDRLQESKKTSDGLMQRAQSQKHFGSTTAFYESASKEQDAKLRRVEEELRTRQLHYKEIEQGLRSKWSLFTGSSAIDSRLQKLENEVQAAKTATAEANEKTSNFKALNQTLEKQVEELKAQLNDLQRASVQNANNVKVLYATTGSLSGTITKHEESLKRLAEQPAQDGTSGLQQQLNEVQRVSAENANGLRILAESNTAHAQCLDTLSKPEGAISTGITQMAQNVTKSVTDWLGSQLQMLDTRIGEMGRDHENLAAEVQKMGVSVQDHVEKLNRSNVENVIKLYHDWKTVEPRLAKLEASLDHINSKSSTDIACTSSGPRNLETGANQGISPGIAQSAVVTSESQTTRPVDYTLFSDFLRLQEAKDDMLAAEDEKFKESLEKIQQQLDGMQEEEGKFRAEILAVTNSDVSKLAEKVNSMQEDHEKLSSQVAGADLTRLVQQLNSLRADHQNLFSHVAAADLTKVMPRIDQMQAEYAKVSESVRKIERIAPSTAIPELWASLSSLSRNIQSVFVGIHSLETRYNNLSTEPIVKSMVVAMEEMYPSAGQLIDEAKKLRERVEKDVPTLEKKIEHLERVHESQKTRFEAMTARYSEVVHINKLMEDIRGELPILKQKIEDLTHVRVCQNQEIAPLKQQIEILTQAQNNQKLNMAPFEKQIGDLSQAQSSHEQDIAPLKQRIESLALAQDNHKLEIAPLKQQIWDLRQAQSSHEQEVAPWKQQIDSLALAQNNHKLEIAPLKQQIGDLRQAQSSHEQEIAPLKQQVGDLRQAQGSYEQEITPLKQRLEFLALAQNNHQLEIAPLKQQIGDLSQAQASHEQVLPNLMQKIDQLEKTHISCEEIPPLKETIEQVKSLSDKLMEIQSINDNNSKTLQSHGASLGNLNAEITRIENNYVTQLRNILHFLDHPTESQPRPQESAPVTSNGNSTPKQESPSASAVPPDAPEDMPSLPLRKKKKKRTRPSALPDDDQSFVSTSDAVASPQPSIQGISAERKRSKKRARQSIPFDDDESAVAGSASNPVPSPKPTGQEMPAELKRPKKKKKKQSNIDNANAILLD